MNRNARSLARIAAAAAVLALAAGSAATAAAQTISACYTKQNGTMYRVGTPNTPPDCTQGSHTKETWNLQGPKGDKGDTGPQGPSGVADLHVFTGMASVNANSTYTISRTCNAGQFIIGLGYDLRHAGLRVKASRPIRDQYQKPVAWELEVENTADSFGQVETWPICITLN